MMAPHRLGAAHAMRTLLGACACTVLGGTSVAAQQASRGTLHVVWDTRDGSGPAAEHYLVAADGRGRLLIPDMSLSDADRLLSLDRRPVEVRGAGVAEPDSRTGAIRTVEVRPLAAVWSAPSALSAATALPSFDFVTVLCRFADDALPSFTRQDVERIHGGSYPGVRHFYRELSWNSQLMAGSTVTPWYTLPEPRHTYVSEMHTDFGALARDCTAAAEGDVDFRSYFGINLQFSSGLHRRATAPYDTLSFGGSWTLQLNGQTRVWGMTWLSGGHAENYVVLTHEMGHALGWPHSSSAAGGEYDSSWDVMSRGYIRWEPPYGWLGVHTISHHKDAIGWVPPARRWTPAWGTIQSGLLARTALPSYEGYLLARIPIDDESFYTAESRQNAGHDRPLPGEAVVLHRVIHQRAYVVDADGDGDPNDRGAQWQAGQEFQDSLRGFSLRVDSASAAGFHVSITRGWRVDLQVQGRGRVIVRSSGLTCESLCSTVISERGTVVTLEAMPAAGATFSHWEGACTTALSCALTLNGNRAVRAVFTPSAVVQALTPALMGAPYRGVPAQVAAGSVQWSVVAGGLPPGLVIDADSGVIAGIPTVTGEYTFTLALRSGAGELQRDMILSVRPPVLSVDGVIDELLGRRNLSEHEIRYLDLLGNTNGKLDVGDVRRWLEEVAELTPVEQTRTKALLQSGRGN